MRVNLTELKLDPRPLEKSEVHENLLANVFVKLKGGDGEYITISNFTFWKKKGGSGYNLIAPNKNKGEFYYVTISESLEARIKKQLVRWYEDSQRDSGSISVSNEDIPVIEENSD